MYNYQPRVIEDASQFDGASIDQLREHFRAEATKREMTSLLFVFRVLWKGSVL
jgi:hypothetical protein